jgi:hypothetical protein
MPTPIIPQPQRQSFLQYRRDVRRQIILPIVLVTIVSLGFGGIAIYAATAPTNQVSLWADISLIWLIIPIMFLALIQLALLVWMVSGLAKALKIAPEYTAKAQGYALWLNAEMILWVDKLIEPVLKLKTWAGLFAPAKEK